MEGPLPSRDGLAEIIATARALCRQAGDARSRSSSVCGAARATRRRAWVLQMWGLDITAVARAPHVPAAGVAPLEG
jgi:hypothetical protein